MTAATVFFLLLASLGIAGGLTWIVARTVAWLRDRSIDEPLADLPWGYMGVGSVLAAGSFWLVRRVGQSSSVDDAVGLFIVLLVAAGGFAVIYRWWNGHSRWKLPAGSPLVLCVVMGVFGGLSDLAF